MEKTKNAKNLPGDNTFPYLHSGPATNTDALLGNSSEGPDTSIPYPGQVDLLANTRGRVIPAGIGATDYIDTNTTQHGVFAGNS